MGKNRVNYFKILYSIIIAVFILGYAAFNFRIFIAGPSVEITNLENGQVFSDPLLKIEGIAQNTTQITINGRDILVEESGNFNESVILYPGYNVLLIKAKDQFERKIEEKLELVFDGELVAINKDIINYENATTTEEVNETTEI